MCVGDVHTDKVLVVMDVNSLNSVPLVAERNTVDNVGSNHVSVRDGDPDGDLLAVSDDSLVDVFNM